MMSQWPPRRLFQGVGFLSGHVLLLQSVCAYLTWLRLTELLFFLQHTPPLEPPVLDSLVPPRSHFLLKVKVTKPRSGHGIHKGEQPPMSTASLKNLDSWMGWNSFQGGA